MSGTGAALPGVLSDDAPDLPPFVAARFPYRRRVLRLTRGDFAGQRMCFVDEIVGTGERDGRPVVLLHGNPTWSFLWRKVIRCLDEQARAAEAGPLRIVAPDLIGLGGSDKPHRVAAHSVAAHAASIAELADVLELEGAIVVGQDWGGPIAMAAGAESARRARGVGGAYRGRNVRPSPFEKGGAGEGFPADSRQIPPNPPFSRGGTGAYPAQAADEASTGRFVAIVGANGTLALPAHPRAKTFHRFGRLPLVSDFVFRVLGFPQGPPLGILHKVQNEPSTLRGDIARAYRWPLGRVRDRAAPLAMARMVPDSDDHPSLPALRAGEAWVAELPAGRVSFVWGRNDPILKRALRRQTDRFPDAPVRVTDAGHFLQEEVPEVIAEAIVEMASRFRGAEEPP